VIADSPEAIETTLSLGHFVRKLTRRKGGIRMGFIDFQKELLIQTLVRDIQRGRITRRNFLSLAGRISAATGISLTALHALTSFTGSAAHAESSKDYPKELIFFQEEPFAKKEFFEKGWYEKYPDNKVVLALQLTEEEAIAKLQAGAIYADVSSVSIGYAHLWFEKELLLPIDTNRLKSYQNMYPYFRDPVKNHWCFQGDQLYVPIFIWGSDSLVVNSDNVPAVDAESLDIVFDEKYKKRICMPNNAAESLAIAGMYLGAKNPFNQTPTELEKSKELLIKQKPLVRTYWDTIGDAVSLMASGEIDMVWGWWPIYTQLKKEGFNVKWAVTKQGQIGWADGNGILKTTKYPDFCLEFMDHTISTDYQFPLWESLGYRVSNMKVKEMMPKEKADALYPEDIEGFLDSLVLWVVPKDPKPYNDAWAEIMAS
jgi:spermidine/putrescine transport system substrate-binding protein